MDSTKIATGLHERALSMAKQFKLAQAALLEVLGEIDKLKAFRTLGFSSLWEYSVSGLRLSEGDAEALIRVACRSEVVPELKTAVVQGEITLSAARRVCSVITPENKAKWINKAATLPQKALEREIVKENPKEKAPDRIRPIAEETSELRCTLSAEVEAMVKRVQDLESQRLGRCCSLEETLRAMAEGYLQKHDPVKKAQRNVGKVARISPVLRRAIPAAVAHQVALRDQGRCTFVMQNGQRCEQKRFVERHPIRPYAIGGKHELENLATLCAAHHGAIHEGGKFCLWR